MSVYKVIELIGTSNKSWQDAADKAVRRAQKTLSNVRVAEVIEQDMDIAKDGSTTYRAKLRVSFKFKNDSKGSKKGSKKRS